MRVRTTDGIDIYVLPECARCTRTGMNPLDMDFCPYGSWNDCVPDACAEYEETEECESEKDKKL